jgi:hypothetical protein
MSGSGLAVAIAAVALATATAAGAAETPAHLVVDRAAVRFLAPETGGVDHPRFILERTLAFEARLEVMGDTSTPQGIGDGYQDRDVRNALEHDVAEQMLATLAQKLIDDSPADQRPEQSEIDGVLQSVSAAVIERLGGQARIDSAAAAEQLDSSEVDAVLRRGAFAAWYLDRVITPLLHPSDEQLRDVFRASAHPFRGQRFEQVHDALQRWFVVDRVRVAEGAFLQASRSHVRIVITK